MNKINRLCVNHPTDIFVFFLFFLNAALFVPNKAQAQWRACASVGTRWYSIDVQYQRYGGAWGWDAADTREYAKRMGRTQK